VTARAVRNSQALEGASNPIGTVAGGTTDAGTIQIGLNSGTVAGHVVDPQNRPVAGAEVIVAGGVDLRTVVTDASGRYRVGNMVAGNLTVTARDPRTGLRARATSLLLLNQSAAVDLRLAPSGTVAGTVFGRDGITPVRSGVTVVLSGPTFVTTTTDVLGHYSVDFVPLGGVTVEASDGSGNRGRATGSLSVTADTVVLDIVFLGRGAVGGTVQDAGRNPVPNASVTLTSESVFGGSRTVTTDGSGRYAFGDVFVGPFSVAAKAPIARLAGKTSGRVDRDGETAAADITLVAAGTFTGIVSRTTGSPVAGVQVTLTPSGLSATTDSLGRYRLDLVPIGSYTVDAADSATGDRGRRSGTLATQDEVRTVDIPLNGQGRVVVTVRDGASETVGGAQVNLDSHTVFGGRLSGMTQSDGTITFDRVLAGNFGLSAADTVTKLTGSRTASVTVGETANVTVQLQSAGSILGSIVGADGSAVANIVVRLVGPVTRQTTTGALGTYRFDIVPSATYAVEALDAAGNLRARAGNLVLSTHRQELLANLTLIGVGTVTGLVRNPDGSVAAGVAVSLQSLAPGFNRSFFALSDIGGRYTIPQVPVGGFGARVSARVGPRQLYGEAQGQITVDGETVTADVQLSATLVPVSTTLYDANNFSYNLRENGSLQDGTGGVFGGDFAANRGALLLDIVTGGTPIRFTGQAFGTATQAGREISIHQSNLAGLEVTRRIFVPRSGYFARYLEVLNNPTASPISVDVKLSSHFRFMRKVQFGFTFDREPQIIATSSGDGVLDVSDPSTRDRWVEIDDDDDGDPFLVNTLAASAHVFDGAGGAQQAGQAQFTVDFTGRFGQLAQAWQNVTIPAGGTVAFLHFITEQTSRAGAQASAERLSQLPPEALTGLTATDISQIQNFAVPADGVSALAPLPSLNGAVSGQVLAGDSETTIAGAQVRYQSRHPLFGRTQVAGSDGAGAFSIRARFDDSGASVAIPVDDFMLNATHPQTAVRSPETPGAFMAGLEVADQNVVFSNSGLVSGLVRRFGGVVVSSGTVQASGGDLINAVTSSIAADGRYRFTSLPAGSYTLGATLPHPQGSALTGASSVRIVNGEARIVDITIPPTGGVTGLVRRENGDVVVNLTVQLRAANFSRSTRTDTGGRFTFADVPPGPVTLETVDAATNTAATASVTVVAAEDVTQHLTLVVGATVVGLVTNPNNQPVSGAQVTLTAANGTFSATSGADGRYRIERVATGQVAVVAIDAATGLRGRTIGSVGLSGQTITVNVRLVVSGTVTGIVFRSDRVTRVAGAQVRLFDAGFSPTTTSDAQGSYAFDFVPLGGFTVDVTDPATGDRGAVSNQVTVNGETRTIDVVLLGLGSAAVTVRDAAENLTPNARVTLYGQTQFGGSQSGATSADGTVTFDRVLAGPIFVSATDPATLLGGSTNATIAPNGRTPVTVHLEPAATVLGQVFAPDGSAVSGATVRLLRSFVGSLRQTTSAGDGSFRFDAAPLGTYTLEALDTGSRVRARESGIRLATNGEIVTSNLMFAGLGTVRGQVLDPDGTAAPNLPVSLRSANPAIGGFFNAMTDDQGRYEIAGVPVGRFTATAEDSARRLLGEASGLIDQDGQSVTADIRLLTNAITLPVTRYDANAFYFDLQGSGSVDNGFNSVFAGDFTANRSAFLLDITAAGSPNRFTGTTLGHTEENGREVVIRQQNLAGLDVTRKIYVPAEGYFARYLEILSNPTANPITVDVRVLSHIRSLLGGPRVVTSSSGDALLDVTDALNPDRWVVIDDSNDRDPFLHGGLQAVAFAFDGPGGAERAGAAAITSAGSGPGQLAYEWKNVTVPSGGSVAYLHFAAQQTSRAAAQASAERLSQLPPEALTGFSAEEVSQIRNFALPPDGVSTLDPLPAINGSISGLVLAGDNATLIAFTQVRLKSRNVLFGRTYFGSSNANGVFTFTSKLDNSGGSIAIPIEGFTLQAFHPQTARQAPITSGGFAIAQTTTTQNIVFSNTGVVRGTVRRHTGAAVTGQFSPGFVQITGSNPFLNITVNLATDGTYLITGVEPGAYTLTAFVFHPQGSSLRGSAPTTVTAGQTTPTDITIEPTGAVTGTVQHAAGGAAASVFVRLRNASNSISHWTWTNAAGQFTIPDVPVGTFTLEAREPRTLVFSGLEVTIARDQTTTQNLTLIGLGQVEVQVNFASGNPAPDIQISVRQGQSTTFPGARTDATGRLVIPFVAVGDFVVRAYAPGDSSIFREVAGGVNNQGEVVPVNLTLPALAAVRLTVLKAEETPFAGAYVYVRHSFTNLRFAGATDANGFLQIPVVPEGDFVIQARDPATSAFAGSATGTITAADDGRAIDVTIRAPLSGNVQGRVFAADQQTPVQFAYTELLEPSGARVKWTYTDASGFYRFDGVVSGYRVVAHSPSDFSRSTERAVTFTTTGETLTIDLALPVGVVRGTVSFSDGAPAPYPNVFITQTDADGNTRTSYAYTRDADGRYTVIGPLVGDFSLVAQDSDGLLTTTVSGTVADITVPVVMDVTLPPSGHVAGTARDAAGNVVTFADVALVSANAPIFYSRWTSTDTEGRYTFDHVPLGTFYVQVCSYDVSFVCGSAAGELQTEGATATADVTLPATQTVSGTVFAADGVTPVPDANVNVENFDHFGENWAPGFWVSTDAAGKYTVVDVPVGTVRATARDPNDWRIVGFNEAIVTTAEAATIDVTLGNAIRSFVDLTGSDGLVYDVDCNGELDRGGTIDGTLSRAYRGAYFLRMFGEFYPCFEAARLEANNRQFVLGPSGFAGLEVVRKTFVPETGGFARYLEIISNPTASRISTVVQVESFLGARENNRVVVAPSATNNTYAITDDSSSATFRPTLSHVFAGRAASVGVSGTKFVTGEETIFYRWNVTVPAGQTVILMHFAVQRGNGDTAAARAQAEALVDLSDPNALAGMTAQEKAQVVNFVIP
jgi:hypothetical protein